MRLVAPLTGTLNNLSVVPDEVFATEILGSGLAIQPSLQDETVDLLAPISGKIVKIHPHAVVIMTAENQGILVHIGINTIKLKGEGFTVHVENKSTVKQLDPLISFNPKLIHDAGYSAIVPIVLMDSKPKLFTIEQPKNIVSGEIILQTDDDNLLSR